METPQARALRILQADKDKQALEYSSCALNVAALRFSSEQCSVLDVLLCINAAQKLAAVFDRQHRECEKLQLFMWLSKVLREELTKTHRSYLYRKCCQRKITHSQSLARQCAKEIGNIMPFFQPLPPFIYKNYAQHHL
ncbi:MAG: hypothetical protein HRU06_05970 [Oceanospirillaceae bacterium]|nr:hypothetical protein [Colwellia sp.]NQZ30799.1 hypothetical protein [Oceanospirillaceae bacterium]